jgi:hypothetical protein
VDGVQLILVSIGKSEVCRTSAGELLEISFKNLREEPA